MKAWSNIEISTEDPEISKINKFEKKLGKLSEKVCQIRELITRFEVCHFKYQEHITKIKDSILILQPFNNPGIIGASHIQKGENAWKNDKTGRSIVGQQYVWAIKKWLDDEPQVKIPDHYNEKLGKQVEKWLGDKNTDKKRLVSLLLARLIWDWKSYEEFQHGGEYKDLEFQICRMDICHYAFPKNMDLLLQGIGKMKPVKEFEGCGSFNENIKAFIKKELLIIDSLLKSLIDSSIPDKNELIKVWLFACLIKTLKEHVYLQKPVIKLPTVYINNL